MTNSSIDLPSVIQASQAIASEIFLNRLLAILIDILLKTSGAKTGYIILENRGYLFIEAQGDIELKTNKVRQSILVQNDRDLPLSLLDYVWANKHDIIIHDACLDSRFNQDIYIKTQKIKSILCIPIIHYGQTIGLLYLENNEFSGAFSASKLEIIKILCAQAAISIENAKLYEEMIHLNQNLQAEIETRNLAENSLKQSQETLQSIIDNSPAVIYLKDEVGQYLLVNNQFEAIFNLSRQEIIGKTDIALFPPDIAENFMANDQSVLQKNRALKFEEKVLQNKEIHTYISVKFPLYNTHKNSAILCGISTDITERKKSEIERSNFIEELALKNIVLEKVKNQLAKANSSLEQKVKERTLELSQTVEILKATQAELMIENALLRSEQEVSQYHYQVGGSLPIDALSYVVRQADRQLYRSLKNGEFCYILNARQMGKSSLRIQNMKHLRAEGIQCVAIDLSSIGSQHITLEQWYTSFAYSLASELGLLPRVNLREWWRENQPLSPIHRLFEFIFQVVLQEIRDPIVIYIDEIDSVMNLRLPMDDFFSLIRSFYNQRSDRTVFQRLTFALFGVATPAKLIADKNTTPFNIGQAISLEGFKPHEAQPLLWGLQEKVKNPQLVLKAVLDWTNGQPFLTQKICQLIHQNADKIPEVDEVQWIDNLVRSRIIENWELKDNPEHLKTIADRLLYNPHRSPQTLLTLYRQIRCRSDVRAIASPDEIELLLSGLVIGQEGVLKVKNRVYDWIFNEFWLEKHLPK
jgi:PAS domain S-box-containing protein